MPVAHTFTRRVLGYYICAFAVVVYTAVVNFRVYHPLRTTAPLVSEWNEQDFSESLQLLYHPFLCANKLIIVRLSRG